MAPKRPLDEPSTSKASHWKQRKHSPPSISARSSNKSESKSDIGPRNEQEKAIIELAQIIREQLGLLSLEDEATLGSVSSLKNDVQVRINVAS